MLNLRAMPWLLAIAAAFIFLPTSAGTLAADKVDTGQAKGEEVANKKHHRHHSDRRYYRHHPRYRYYQDQPRWIYRGGRWYYYDPYYDQRYYEDDGVYYDSRGGLYFRFSL